MTESEGLYVILDADGAEVGRVTATQFRHDETGDELMGQVREAIERTLPDGQCVVFGDE